MTEKQFFESDKSSDCSHLNTKQQNKYEYIPAGEIRDSKTILYCQKTLKKDVGRTVNQFNEAYNVELVLIQTLLAKTKTQIGLIYEEMDQYDQKRVECGIHHLLKKNPKADIQMEKECEKLIRVTDNSLQKINEDFEICTNVYSKPNYNPLEKMADSIQAGCHPLSKVRERIEYELQYVLQQYQKYINVKLGLFARQGKSVTVSKHETSYYHYAKHVAGKVYHVLKRGLGKLLTFLKSNWENVMLLTFVSLGPLLFYSIPWIAGVLSTTVYSGFLSWPTLARKFFCHVIPSTPLIGWALFEMLKRTLGDFMNLSKEERDKKYKQEKWAQELALNASKISSLTGMASPTVSLTVSVGKKMVEVGQATSKEINTLIESDVPPEFQSIPKFLLQTGSAAGKIALFKFLTHVANIPLQSLCGTVGVIQAGVTAIGSAWTNLFNLRTASILGPLIIGVKDAVVSVVEATGWLNWFSDTNPFWVIGLIFEGLLDPNRGETLLERIVDMAKDEEIVQGFLQLITIIWLFFLSFQKVWDWGNVSAFVSLSIPLDPILQPSTRPSLRQTVDSFSKLDLDDLAAMEKSRKEQLKGNQRSKEALSTLMEKEPDYPHYHHKVQKIEDERDRLDDDLQFIQKKIKSKKNRRQEKTKKKK